MFGSKLRSWMENHIVRPRKKGSKNKNANSSIATTSTAAGSHEAYKKTVATGFTIYHGNGTTTTTTSITASSVPSTGSGANNNGCSSSSGISSPVRRREVSPIQNHTQSRYGWQSPDQETVTSPKSDNFLYAPQHHRVRTHHHQHQHHHHHSTAPNSKENSCAETKSVPNTKIAQQPDLSSSSISSLSWSTGSKEQSNNQQPVKPLPLIEMHCNSPPDSSFQMLTESTSELWDLDEDPNAVHYEEIQTILRHPENMANNNFTQPERPKSEQLSSFLPSRSLHDGQTQDDASTRYGRLLPSKIQSSDSLNANYMRSGSAESIPSNNNQRPFYQGAQYHNALVTHTHRSRFRTNRQYMNPGLSGAQAPAAGALHSLSSPESAYSTGYSTDGTSPGGIYTPPEYYINMRTGTHYFPKSVNSLAIEAQRYKFGLNKIEEMSPIDPLPKTSFANAAKRLDSNNDSEQGKIPNFLIPTNEHRPMDQHLRSQSHPMTVGCHSPLALRNTIVLPTLKGFESPSPRQRCRIRTNPWYSTTDTSSSGTTIGTTQPFAATSASSTISSTSKSACSAMATMKMELDAASSTSSSGIKSSNEAEGSSDKNKHNGKTSTYDSSESSSSLTEVENMQRTYSPNTIRRKRSDLLHHHHTKEGEPLDGLLLLSAVTGGSSRSVGGNATAAECYADNLLSDDDATLNEMMGKFDESYVYEKETDILSSDSDPTDCPSDLDTGQDAGDECDTDELLDIDFIDTSSIHEVYDRMDMQNNLGSCSYYGSISPTRLPKHQLVEGCAPSVRRNSSRRNSRRSTKANHDSSAGGGSILAPAGSSQRRRKRFMKTRKKSSDSRDQFSSPIRRSRESRSVGGTPVCLRRNHSAGKERIYKTSPLSNRSSSLVFTDVRERRFMTIAESEKALLKADLEADVKYRQLILEAESILVSMKNSLQSIPRDTPVASPRRVNPLANKRVEMLKNCEVEPKRDQPKQHQAQRSFDASSTPAEQELAAAINKRIELLKLETASAPNSPKFSRFSPRKTHLTNFMNQNAPTDVPPMRKQSIPDFPKPPQSPQLQINGRRMQSPTASPLNRRRFRSQSPRMKRAASIDSDSDCSFKHISNSSNSLLRLSRESIRNMNFKASADDMTNHNYLPEIERIMLYDDPQNDSHCGGKQPPLMPFNSVGGYYCPQSEPLKRKVYKGSSTFERIKKSFDLESEIPKQAILAKIHNLRKLSSAKSSSHEINHSTNNVSSTGADEDASIASNMSSKKQLILSTIADLKRSLESQSVELNGLNGD